MRQYRGLTKEGKWVYGWYLGTHNPTTSNTSWIIKDGLYVTDILIGLNDTKFPKMLQGCYKVIPETVGQSTGYNYKSKKKAFEGDIFDAYPDGTHRFLRTIIWNDELARFQAPYSDGSGLQLFTKKECLLYEYVGNIHQNPDLMEQENG